MESLAPELKRRLSAGGCSLVRPGRGDYEIWFSPAGGVHVVVDADIRSRHTANAVLEQAGLPRAF